VLGKNKKVYCLMFLTSLFWAGAFIGGKFGVRELSPISLTFLRLFFASIFVGIFTFKIDPKSLKLNMKDVGIMTTLAVVGVVGYQVLLFTALKYTTSSNASILVSFSPLITTVLAYFFNDESICLKKIFAVLLGMLGVILTISNWNLNIIKNLSFNIGDLIMLIAATTLGVYSIIVKRVINKYKPLLITTCTLVISVFILFPFSLKAGLVNNIFNLSWETWLSVLYMAIFPTVIAYLIQQKSIKIIGSSKTEMFRNTVPIFSMVLAYFFLKESISLL